MIGTDTATATPGITAVTSNCIDISNLRKHFGANRVLRDIYLSMPAGHIVGLIGPNSAGKSTLLRHLVGLYLPTEGRCQVLGRDPASFTDQDLMRIGYVHQEGELMDWMWTRQIIDYVAAHYPRWNRELEAELVDRFDLRMSERVAVMSPGQRQKLGILLAVCYEPELLILDEPASALDPIARKEFLELLLNIIQDRHRTVIISSHILSDVEKVIDHVWFMKEGEIIRDCSFDDLLDEYVKLEITALEGDLPKQLPLPNLLSCERDDRQAMVIMKRRVADAIDLEQVLSCRVESRPLTLEEIYPLVMGPGRQGTSSSSRGTRA